MTIRRSCLALALVAGAFFCCGLFAATTPATVPAPAHKPRELILDVKPWKGDFDGMLERRMIRVLVPYSRSLYFIDKGRERGVTADLVRQFEAYLNRKYAKQLGKRPLTVYMIITNREKMLTNIADGLGDIAAANLTDTPEREKIVDMIAPRDQKPVSEVVVTGPKAPQVATLDDLSGKTIHVRKSSSYYESIVALNKRLAAGGKAPVQVTELPDALEDEDQLEMLNAGLLDFIVVDDWKAHLWSKILPKVKVRDDLVMRSGGFIGWAIRKDSPKLHEAAMDFYTNFIKKQSGGAHIQFERRIQQIRPNTASDEVKRFNATIQLFQKYGGQYSFDPLMLAAQGYQESALNQDAKSQVGAIGVMQLMPATGSELGVGDIHKVEPNIHGGAKYMDQLLTRYFKDANFSDSDRPLFAFAAYNAGPGNIAKMRKIAAERGLDPDKWFNNVEVVVSEKIGIETTTYVRNIYKYYVAYKLTQQAQETSRKAREEMEPPKAKK